MKVPDVYSLNLEWSAEFTTVKLRDTRFFLHTCTLTYSSSEQQQQQQQNR